MTATLQSEPTPEGEQTLIPGVLPVTMRERLAARMASPMAPRKPQQPFDFGLFDRTARRQLDLFQSTLK